MEEQHSLQYMWIPVNRFIGGVGRHSSLHNSRPIGLHFISIFYEEIHNEFDLSVRI